MSVQPGLYNIKLQRRANYELQLQFFDENQAAINLTNWIAKAQIWDKARTVKYADFSVNYLNRATGTIKISLAPSETDDLPCDSYWDLLLINPSGLKEYYLEGSVYASEGYTE